MPITAETFELKHFDNLARGISVAREAFEQLQEDLEKEEDARQEAEDRIRDMEEERREKPTIEQWRGFMEFVLDVERGLRTPEELFAFAREQGEHYDLVRND